jgi:predicted regulator of Ras-like GTPase activity (Roadblock/LC7/MglB family)
MNNLVIDNFKKELERLENFGDIIGTAIVNRNGLLICSKLPIDIDERKFSALAATMFEAIETATSTLETAQINNLTVEFKDYQLIVVGADDNIILVILVDLNINLGLIFIEIEESVKNIKRILKG